jgi:hypothetical protein
MNALELFDAWAPEGAPWSPWAKPVLFAAEGAVPGGASGVSHEWQAARARARALATLPAPSESALVLDLQGPLALALALECAARGWRPVPLFNSCPGPGALVDNESIRAGLAEGAPELLARRLPDTAAPVFVLDSRRTDGVAASGRFDNRWVVFPQDFPSAARLLAAGLRRVLLVQEGRREPRADLAHVLLRWQEARLEILALDLAAETVPSAIVVPKPSRFRGLGYRALVAIGLRKSSAGGFGGLVPTHSTGTGGAMWA